MQFRLPITYKFIRVHLRTLREAALRASTSVVSKFLPPSRSKITLNLSLSSAPLRLIILRKIERFTWT